MLLRIHIFTPFLLLNYTTTIPIPLLQPPTPSPNMRNRLDLLPPVPPTQPRQSAPPSINPHTPRRPLPLDIQPTDILTSIQVLHETGFVPGHFDQFAYGVGVPVDGR